MSDYGTKEIEYYEDLTDFVFDPDRESTELPLTDSPDPPQAAGDSIEVSTDEKTYEEIEEVTIKFSPRLADKFEGKDGNAYYEIKMPNLDNEDKSPWWHFVLPEKAVHEDNYSEKLRLWSRLPADGNTTLKRSRRTDKTNEEGKPIYKEETYSLGNRSLAKMMDPKVRERVNASHDKDIAIRITKKLVGDPFRSKDGKTYREVKIPNENPEDKTPWAHFVVSPGQVHEDKFIESCNVLYLPENGSVTIRRDIKTDVLDENGKAVYEKQTEKISVKDLAKMLNGGRESVKDKLNDKQREVDEKKADTPEKKHEIDKSVGIE